MGNITQESGASYILAVATGASGMHGLAAEAHRLKSRSPHA